MRPGYLTSVVLTSALAALPTSGCNGEEFLVITVESRPAVHSPVTLAVKVSNGSSEVAQNYTVTAGSFPASFSVGPGPRSTPLQISVEARDAMNLLAGRGSATVGVDAESGKIVLESADFVINTDFAGDQVPATDPDMFGNQVAAGGDRVTVVYRNNPCPTAGCEILARRLDASGRPLSTQVAAGTNSFKMSTVPTTFASEPAVAANADAAVAVWDYSEVGAGTAAGISCRALNAEGAATPSESLISTDTLPDVPAVTALANGNFAVVWNALSPRVVRGAVVRADCSVVVAPVTLSLDSTFRTTVASGPGGVMAAWVLTAAPNEGTVLVRSFKNELSAASSATIVASKTATEKVEYVRLAPLGDGYAVVVRWAQLTGTTGPGRIEMFRVNNLGMLQGEPTLVSEKSGTDFESRQSFGVSTRSDGSLMIVWHACNENGDGEGCGVYGRVFNASGAAVGEEFVLATTTQGSQTKPSVAGLTNAFFAIWSDESGTDPDRAGTSVRGRVLYPSSSGGGSQ